MKMIITSAFVCIDEHIMSVNNASDNNNAPITKFKDGFR